MDLSSSSPRAQRGDPDLSSNRVERVSRLGTIPGFPSPTVASPQLEDVLPGRLLRPQRLRHADMPLESDDSDSEPDVSFLQGRPNRDMERSMARALGTQNIPQSPAMDADGHEDDPEQFEAEDTSIDEQEIAALVDPTTMGLKEISNLAKFTVSSHKQGNGVEELRSDNLNLYWQSDGPQPHRLTVYFVKRVGIRDIRYFVDYNEDESYTPTKVVFKSGTSENNLIEFATMNLDSPVGWQQVPVAGAGGDPDGNTLVSYVLQMQILENHQNGKDTHLRGIKIYAFDPESTSGTGRDGNPVDDVANMIDDAVNQGQAHPAGDRMGDITRTLAAARLESGEMGFSIPDFMREPEIR